MGMKNSSKKPSLLKREGFYVVLFLCLCVVAVITVYISKTNTLKEQELAQNKVAQIEEIQDATEVNNNIKSQKKEDSTNNQNNKVEDNTNKESAKKEEDKSEDKKEEKTAKSTSAKKTTISLEGPVVGEINKKFSDEELQHTKALDIWETHEGVDIACSLGTEVKAAQTGKVVDIYNDDKAEKTLKSGFGVTVILEHDNGFRTMYSNLAENLKVKKGDKVEAGKALGLVGDTSVREDIKVDGAHLHFSLLKKDGKDYKAIDPTSYLKK